MGRLSKLAAAVGPAALLIAGGGAFALASSSGGTISVCVKHKGGALYKAGTCAKHDKKLSWNKGGPAGPSGPQGNKGDAGPQGNMGDAGPAGTAVAYARIAADGTLDAAHSKNITSSSLSPGTGIYCITPSVQVTSVVVSVPHVAGDTGNHAQANVPANGDGGTVNCSTPVWVATWNGSGTLEDHPFYLIFN